jgi:hypothetical protein
MRSTLLFTLVLCACGGGGNDVDPRVVPGGGVGDGAIDGEVNIHVIDADTDAPITGAQISVADGAAITVDATGLAVVADVEGPQVIAVKAQGYRSAVWDGADGANVTIPLTRLDDDEVGQATLSGTIADYAEFSVDDTHVRAAAVIYAQSDTLGDAANNLATPGGANVCSGPADCTWSLVSRTGTLHVAAALIDLDPMGTVLEDDDVVTVAGWAIREVTVEDGVDQSGLVLEPIESGNLAALTIDLGTPPAALTETAALVGLELGDDEVLQLPYAFLAKNNDSMLAPTLDVFPGSTYRLTAVAQTSSAEDGAQSVILARGQTATELVAGTWLVPPTGVAMTRTTASWQPVAGALFHQLTWDNAAGDTVLEITVFDPAATTATIPTLVALPASGTLTGKVGGLAATLDPTDFSLDADIDTVSAIASEPATVD